MLKNKNKMVFLLIIKLKNYPYKINIYFNKIKKFKTQTLTISH